MIVQIRLVVFFILIFFNQSLLAFGEEKQNEETIEEDELVILYDQAGEAFADGAYILSYELYEKGIEIGTNSEDWEYVAYGLICQSNIANEYDSLSLYHQLILHSQDVIQKHYEELGDYKEYYKSYFEISEGYYYYRRGSYNRAQDHFDILLSKITEEENLNYDFLTKVNWHLGAIHKKKGNYEIALNHILECLKYYEKADQAYFQVGFKGLMYKHLGEIYDLLGKRKLAIQYYEKSIQLLGNIYENGNRKVKNRIISSYNAYAQFYINNKDFNKAIDLLQVSVDYHGEKDPMYEETYRIIAETYAKGEAYKRAAMYFEKSIDANRYDLKNYQKAKTYTAMGAMYTQQKEFDLALTYFQKALVNLKEDYDESDICSNPQNFKNLYSKKELLQTLYQKAVTLFEYSKINKKYLDCSWRTTKYAMLLIDNIKLDFTNDHDKQYLANESYQLFEKFIEISLAQNTKKGNTFALEIAEKSKSTLLLAAVRNTQIRDYFVPDSLINLEQKYHSELQELEEKIYLAKLEHKSIHEINTKMVKLRQDLAQLHKYLKNNYSKYYALRYGNEVDSPNQIKKWLRNDQAFIEYFVGENKSYIFLLQKNKELQVFEIKQGKKELTELVQSFLHSIYIPYVESEDAEILALKEQYTKTFSDQVYAQKAHELYSILLQPAIESIGATNQLEIIPDGVLNYLPFSALLENEVNPNMIGYYENEGDYHYLARKYQLSYCYSATLMRLMKDNSHSSSMENGLLVFHDADFESQVNSIESIFESFWFLRPFVHILQDGAHKESLRSLSHAYKYLHFSVHGRINNDRPHQSHLKLRYSPETKDSLLYLRDIYNLSIPAHMVFTSACNAGVGPLLQGEGLMSLARGFTYSGAKSLITTLWMVKGGPTDNLLKEFYEKLGQGYAKDEALSLAKRKNMKLASYAHPYYWAGFIPIGDMEPIETPMGIRSIIGIAVLAFCSLFLFFFFKRKAAQ